MPEFSIVLPCFNAAATLGDTLDSLIGQSLTDWEAICVDDGSTDRTAALIQEYSAHDGRIRLATHPGQGPSAARNAGALHHATGQFIAFCDADDIWHPKKLVRLQQSFADPAVDAAYGRVAFFDGDRPARMRFSTVPGAALTIRMLLAENPVCTMSNLTIRRDCLAEWGGFDEKLNHNEDLDWLIRLAGNGARIIGDPELHVLYRTGSRGLSSDLYAMRSGRDVALATAAHYGVHPYRRDEAIFARYLARRALRLDDGAWTALRFTLAGLSQSPLAFLFPLRRGAATAAASIAAPLMPRAVRRALFTV